VASLGIMNSFQKNADATTNSLDYSFVVPTDAAGTRLDRFLSDQLPELSRTRIQHWIEQGSVLVDDILRL
jgi:23S rRNA-/tRNA-specific pseudouridylate synthase